MAEKKNCACDCWWRAIAGNDTAKHGVPGEGAGANALEPVFWRFENPNKSCKVH